MVIVEAAQSPIYLNEFALFEKLNVKTDKIRYSIRSILDGNMKIKNKDDENEVKDFIDKNESKFKEIYEALNVDLTKYNSTKEGRKAIISLIIFLISSVAIIFVPTAVIFGSIIIPVEFITLLTQVISFIYTVVKGIIVSSKNDSINEAYSALSKIKSSLKKLNIEKFKNKELQEHYNNLIAEIDQDMKTVRGKRA